MTDPAGHPSGFAPYSGPRPSRSRRWAPLYVVVLSAVATAKLLLAGLNLYERHLQQRRTTSDPPTTSQVHNVVSAIKAISSVVSILLIALIVVSIIWSSQRRSRARLAQYGEAGVEPHVFRVWPALYVTSWALLAIAVIAGWIARSYSHATMTVDDFVQFRTYRAAADLGWSGVWSCWIALVVRSTKLQHRREAAGEVSPGQLSQPSPEFNGR